MTKPYCNGVFTVLVGVCRQIENRTVTGSALIGGVQIGVLLYSNMFCVISRSFFTFLIVIQFRTSRPQSLEQKHVEGEKSRWGCENPEAQGVWYPKSQMLGH